MNVSGSVLSQPNFAQQGWQCPICRAVWAPMICGCLKCSSSKTTVTGNTTGTIRIPAATATTETWKAHADGSVERVD